MLEVPICLRKEATELSLPTNRGMSAPQNGGICQTGESGPVSPALADKAPAVLQRYYESAPTTFLTQHHIASYEACVFREIPDIIAAENPIVVLKEPLDDEKGIYQYKTEIFVGGDAEASAIDVGPPILTLDGGKTVRRLFANEARLRNLTYAAQFRADILIRLTFTKPNSNGTGYDEKVHEIRAANFPLFRIPILLRSRLCASFGAGEQLLKDMGECPNDQGGYFIIDGAEKVLITRGEQALNSVFVSPKPPQDPKVKTYATVVCQHPTTKRSNRVALYRLKGNQNVEDGAIRVSIPFVKGAVPLFVLFRALGVESDEEIVRMIIPTPSATQEATLVASVHDAWPVTSQALAVEFLRTLTKGFITAHVLNILHEHLFSHVPDRPLAKAQYLAEIVRKMLRVEEGREPATNRDDMRNQRFLPAGILLRGLFGECWKLWKKAVIYAVDTQYNYNRSSYKDENFLNLFVPANLTKILATQTLNDELMRGFRGRWGTNQYNMKTGVIQPLARISYLDAVSHTRRVVSDFDTSLKLTGPRQLHTSQVGYFCTSETPTGAHIGATKNMSIMTTFSCAVPQDPVIRWLLGRGGVVEVAAAPRSLAATAASVQVNGGTIGFTESAGELTRVLKLMKWTGCLSPYASVAFNTADNILRIYLDDGRPMRPLWHLAQGGAWPPAALKPLAELPTWRELVMGTFPGTAELGLTSVAFVDPLANEDAPTLGDYGRVLGPHIGAIEYVDPYEGNEAYVSWWGSQGDLTADHTHAEIHPSTMMGILASMIPFANHNQSPRNQLSCSQSKQAIGYYATNYENRFDTYGSMLCYGEGAMCRTIVHDAVARGSMPYGTNLIFAFNCFNGYNQDDGIIFNRSSIERGLFRSLALRSYETVEEDDALAKVTYRVGNPKYVGAWTDVKPGNDYTQLDDTGVIREGAVIHDKTVLVGRYMVSQETGKVVDASLLPTVFTRGRVDRVVVLHQANGLRLIKVRILEERVPELGDKFCLDASHDVLTRGRGWVPIADVSTSDQVAQLNPDSQQIEFVSPKEIFVFDHDGDMWEVQNKSVSQRVTPNHRMWVRGATETAFGFREVATIQEPVTYLAYDCSTETVMESYEVDPTADVSVTTFVGKVYCLSVPSQIFLVRRHGRMSFTGNSTRHGQKGTMGMLLDAQDMPRTADGIVPDVLVNPHCIPSRMTMAQMLEQLFGKLGAVMGAKMNATPFMNDAQSMKAVGDALEALGLQRAGEEIMYAGTTGVQFSSAIFIGPLNFMRLKHLAQDKINARSAGRREQRTHQPTGGRGNEGGMRIGEMERDVLIAHGITDFLTESMMRRSDGTSFWVCNGCGTIPITNEAEGLFVCAQCDGPLMYQGATADTIGLVMPVRKSRCTFSRVEVPYALKLLDQELTTYMNAGFRFLTGRDGRRPRDPVLGEEPLADQEEAVVPTKEAKDAVEARLDALAAEVAADTTAQAPPPPRAMDVGAEEAPEDNEDEGQPEHNEGEEVVAAPVGEKSVDFDVKRNKEFSNYFPAKFILDGKEWPTVEHYFQAAKFPNNEAYRETIRITKKPEAAKRLGKTKDVPADPDWMKKREEVMYRAVLAKFQQHPKLREKLLGTGDLLIRDMSPQDNFWGVGRSGKGQNKLGKTLMKARDTLRGEQAPSEAAKTMAMREADAMLMAPVPPAQPTEQPPTQPQPQQQQPLQRPPDLPPLPEEPNFMPAATVQEEGLGLEPVGNTEIEIDTSEPIEILPPPNEENEENQEGGKSTEDWGKDDHIKVIKF